MQRSISEGVVTNDDAKNFSNAYNEYLENEYQESRKHEKAMVYDFLQNSWEGFRHGLPEDFEQSPETGIAKKRPPGIRGP